MFRFATKCGQAREAAGPLRGRGGGLNGCATKEKRTYFYCEEKSSYGGAKGLSGRATKKRIFFPGPLRKELFLRLPPVSWLKVKLGIKLPEPCLDTTQIQVDLVIYNKTKVNE